MNDQENLTPSNAGNTPDPESAPVTAKANAKDTSWIRRPCLWVAVGIKWLPVAFITSVIGWSYYAFVVVICFMTVENVAEKVVFLTFYHIILVLFGWSYAKTIFAPKCETPSSWKLSKVRYLS